MDWRIAEGVEWLGEDVTEDHPQHHSAILGETQAATKGRAGTKGCKSQGERYKKNQGIGRLLFFYWKEIKTCTYDTLE